MVEEKAASRVKVRGKADPQNKMDVADLKNRAVSKGGEVTGVPVAGERGG